MRCLLLDPSCSGEWSLLSLAARPIIAVRYNPVFSPSQLHGSIVLLKLNNDCVTENSRVVCAPGSGVVRALERVLETDSTSHSASAEDRKDDALRLKRLQDFQIQVIAKAMSFPAAEYVSYSTCSVHEVRGVVQFFRTQSGVSIIHSVRSLCFTHRRKTSTLCRKSWRDFRIGTCNLPPAWPRGPVAACQHR